MRKDRWLKKVLKGYQETNSEPNWALTRKVTVAMGGGYD